MCFDCEDSITSIPSGPPGATGPQGPQGDTPVLSGTSTTSILIGTGSKTFTTQSGISWNIGQRLRVSDSTTNNLMEGEITAYSGTSLTILVDYIEGSGTIGSWTITITGAVGQTGATGSTGSTGATGKNAYGDTTGVAISLGANLYTVPIVDNAWGKIGQIIYIETAGYYQITNVTPTVDFTVLDLLYSGNNASNMTSTASLGVSPGGIKGNTGGTGATGATGPAGPTGASGTMPTFTYARVLNTSIPSSTSISLFTAASSLSNIAFTVTGYVESNDAITVTAELYVNAVATGIKQVITGSAPLGGLSNIGFNLSGVTGFANTNAITLVISADDYTKASVARLVNITYTYQ